MKAAALRPSLILLCLLPGLAWAEGEAYQAVQFYRELEYGKALEAAQKALKLPIQEPAELVSVYRIQGLCLSALGKSELALEAFRSLLSIDPSFRLSQDVSPKLAAPFFQALAMVREHEGIQLASPEPEVRTSLAGLILEVTLEADPLSLVKTIRLRFRLDSGTREKQMVARLTGAKTVAMKLPADVEAKKLSYYFEALNQHGAVLHRLGSRPRPMTLTTRPGPPKPLSAPVAIKTPPRQPEPLAEAVRVPRQPARADRSSGREKAWYQTWWFWSAVGVAAAGVTTAAILAADSGSSDQSVDYGVRIK